MQFFNHKIHIKEVFANPVYEVVLLDEPRKRGLRAERQVPIAIVCRNVCFCLHGGMEKNGTALEYGGATEKTQCDDPVAGGRSQPGNDRNLYRSTGN